MSRFTYRPFLIFPYACDDTQLYVSFLLCWLLSVSRHICALEHVWGVSCGTTSNEDYIMFQPHSSTLTTLYEATEAVPYVFILRWLSTSVRKKCSSIFMARLIEKIMLISEKGTKCTPLSISLYSSSTRVHDIGTKAVLGHRRSILSMMTLCRRLYQDINLKSDNRLLYVKRSTFW